MRLLIISNYSKSILNFRGDLINTLLKNDFSIRVIVPKDKNYKFTKEVLENLNVKINSCHFHRGNLSAVFDIYSFFRLIFLFIIYRPQKLLLYTSKPIIYGSIAAFICKHIFHRKIDIISILPGLGHAFGFYNKDQLKMRLIYNILKNLYHLSLSLSDKIIFLNNDDKNLFISKNIIKNGKKVFVVLSEGVNLSRFRRTKLPNEHVFLMMTRLIHEKGVLEYLKASKLVKEKYTNTSFNLAGPFDLNPSKITKKDFYELTKLGEVNYLGDLKDVYCELEKCRYFILPSYYREGVPRSLLEALAVGRPIITTDLPGCKETLHVNKNGFFANPRDYKDLARLMIKLITLEDEKINNMAKYSYQLAKNKFDIDIVNDKILNIIKL
tara:strand:- start:9038 stop:10183 length:1146 start_codon:yes stop_codon:yes gene_type:complete